MNKRLTIQDVAGMLADYTGKDRKNAELFLKEFITLLTKGVYTDKIVKVKGLGTFKIILVERRESIHVNTGERFVIPEHYKFSFVPDKELKELVNKPFSFFETTELNENIDFSDLDETEEEAKDIDPEDESIEEILPDKETPQTTVSSEPIEIQGPLESPEQIAIQKKTSAVEDMLTPPEEPVREINEQIALERMRAYMAQAAGIHREIIQTEPDEKSKDQMPQEPVTSEEKEDTQEEAVLQKTVAIETKPTEEMPRQSAQVEPVGPSKNAFPATQEEEEPRYGMPEEKREKLPEDERSTPFSTNKKSIRPVESDDPFAPDAPLETNTSEESDNPFEADDLEDENPYEEDFDFPGEGRPRAGNGASFKKKVVLFFSLALLLIIGAYAYLNKDIVMALIHGGPVVSIDTTDISDQYAASEQAALDEIREITEASSLQLPSDLQTDSLIDLAETQEKTETSVLKTEPESREETLPVQTPAVQQPKPQPATHVQSAENKPSVSSGKSLATVKIEPGSRLTLISLKYYGHKIFWVYLYEHNKARISDPNNVPIGTLIEVPAPELYGINAHSREAINKASVKQTEILSGE